MNLNLIKMIIKKITLINNLKMNVFNKKKILKL